MKFFVDRYFADGEVRSSEVNASGLQINLALAQRALEGGEVYPLAAPLDFVVVWSVQVHRRTRRRRRGLLLYRLTRPGWAVNLMGSERRPKFNIVPATRAMVESSAML